VNTLAPATPIEVWFQDEMRIGQKNGLVYQWAKKGTRPRQPKDQRYENAYLFGAVCPGRNTGIAVIMPHADTEAMQRHVDEISLAVAPGAHALIILDDRFHEAGIEKPASMEPEVCWWIPRLRRAERGATSWQHGGRRLRW